MIRYLLAALLLVLQAHLCLAVNVKEIASPSGIKAWFVERRSVPLIHVRFAFAKGSLSDEPGKGGTAMFLTGMMDEGAGGLDGPTFQKRIQDLGIAFGFDHGFDNFYGSLSTPIQFRAEAAQLLRAALTETSFPPEAADRMRQYFLSRESALAQNPESIANRAALGLALPGHPYTMAELGYAEGLKKITPDDLAAARQRIFVKSGLQVAIVGDLSAEEAARYLDDLFGALPEGTRPNPDVKSSLADGPKVKVIAADTAQTLLQFGSQGLPESDPDYHAAVIATFMAYSTLNDVLREQRGLTYGVSFDLLNFNKAHLVIGRAKTANASASAALGAIKEALGLMHDPGPNLDVLNRSKAYLKGRFALGFDSGADMAGSLLNQKLSGFSSNYISVRNDLIDQVTLEDVKRAIKRIIAPEKLLVVAVGRPEGLE